MPSKRRSYASTPPLPAPHPPPSALPPVASTLRSSVLPCAFSSTYALPLPFAEIILSLRKEGSGNTDASIGSPLCLRNANSIGCSRVRHYTCVCTHLSTM